MQSEPADATTPTVSQTRWEHSGPQYPQIPRQTTNSGQPRSIMEIDDWEEPHLIRGYD